MANLLSREGLARQILVTHTLLDNQNYKMAAKELNDIVRNIRKHEISDCDKGFMHSMVDYSFRTLIDISFKRYDEAIQRTTTMNTLTRI